MSAADIRFKLLLQRYLSNKSDVDAMYQLSLHYAYGWGIQEDVIRANSFLEEAAKLGHAKACYEIVRKNLGHDLQVAAYFVNIGLKYNPGNDQLIGLQRAIDGQKSRQNSDKKQLEEARTMLATKAGLSDAINTELVPCIVSIVTENGGIGSGFYQHSEWLVSNAHVLPNTEVLKNSKLRDFQHKQVPIKVKRAFHRPSHNTAAPDIVIVKGNSRTDGNTRCLPSFSDYEDCGERVTFYVYYNHVKQAHEIKYLKNCSKANAYPMIYECEDGDPMPGCSGAPVIEARVVIGGHETKWEFQTVGAIYARYPKNGKKLLCAIPIRQEFGQILGDIIHPEESSKRARQMAAASGSLHQDKQELKYRADSEEHAKLAKIGLAEFEAGKTNLNIDLPPYLEKLIYSNQELINMSDRDARDKLGKSDQQRRKQLKREEIKEKEEVLAELKIQAEQVKVPITDKFRTDHMGNLSHSFKDSVKHTSKTRHYKEEYGEKSSSAVRMTDKEARDELKTAVAALKSDDLTRKPDGSYDVKHGVLHQTQSSYRTASQPLKFSRPGHRKMDGDLEQETAAVNFGIKIDKGVPKIHHLDGLVPKKPDSGRH